MITLNFFRPGNEGSERPDGLPKLIQSQDLPHTCPCPKCCVFAITPQLPPRGLQDRGERSGQWGWGGQEARLLYHAGFRRTSDLNLGEIKEDFLEGWALSEGLKATGRSCPGAHQLNFSHAFLVSSFIFKNRGIWGR